MMLTDGKTIVLKKTLISISDINIYIFRIWGCSNSSIYQYFICIKTPMLKVDVVVSFHYQVIKKQYE